MNNSILQASGSTQLVKIVEICLSLIMLFLMIFRSLIKNVGNGFPVPNGPIIFISLKKFLLRAREEISAS